jgi:type I restriction enzyme S subunit
MSTATLHIEKKKALVPELRFQEFDGNWFLNQLDAIVDKKISYGIVQAGEHVENGMPYIKSQNLNNEINLFELQRTSDEIAKKYQRSEVKPGDIVFSLRGNIGVSRIVPSSIEVANLTQGTARISVSNLFYNRFIHFSLQINFIIKQVSEVSKGSTFQEISLEALRKIKIPTPILPEQQKIASFLSAVDEKIQQLSRKKELLVQYKKGVMQQLFSGKLRFKDENANDYADWEEKNISSVCKRSSGKSKSENISEDGENIIVDMGSISRDCKLIGNKRTNCQDDYLETNELVMVKDDIGGGNIIGKVVMIPFNNKYVCGDHVYKLKVLKGDVLYIYFAINSYEVNKSFRRKANGTAQIGINNRTVDEQKIPFPCFAEQQKIANFLSSIDAKIESTSQQISQTQSFKKGLLQQMFV